MVQQIGRNSDCSEVAEMIHRTSRLGRCLLTVLKRGTLFAVAAFLILISFMPSEIQAGWQVFLPADGLVHASVTSVYEDSLGSIWFGTVSGGISEFDGLNWTDYFWRMSWPDGPEFPADIRDILEDRDGNMWFTNRTAAPTVGLLARFDGENWDGFRPVTDGLWMYGLYRMIEDSSGELWLTTFGGGVLRFDGETWQNYRTADGLANDKTLAVCQDSQGVYWIGTDSGISRFDGQFWQTLTDPEGPGANSVNEVFEDSSGNLWFVSLGILYRYDGWSWTAFHPEVDHPLAYVRRMTEDDYGRIWIAGGYGVACYDGIVWVYFTAEDGIPYYAADDIIADSYGNIWIATASGAARFDGEYWDYITTDDGLRSNRVTALLEASPGTAWIGMSSADLGGLSFYDGSSFTNYSSADGMLSDGVSVLCLASDGRLWVGCNVGVSVFDGSGWTTDSLSSYVEDICEDNQGNIWIAMRNAGLIRVSGEVWEYYDESDGLPTSSFRCLEADTSAGVWVGGFSALGHFDGLSWVWYTPSEGLPCTHVYDLTVASNGEIWLGTSCGVSSFDGENWTNYTTDDGLANDQVFRIYEGRDGDIWCGTVVGLSRFGGGVWRTFTEVDGLLTGEIISIFEDRSGRVWVGSNDPVGGISIYGKDRVSPKTLFSPVPAALSASRRQIFTSLAAYGETRGIEFSYSLDGSPWSLWSRDNFWVVEGLADGVHEIAVRSRDRMGNVDPSPAEATFEIDATPPVPVISGFGSGMVGGEGHALGSVLRDTIVVMGTAADARFETYRLEMRRAGTELWVLLAESWSPVVEAALGGWNTSTVPDGQYELRLSERDTLGLTGIALVTVIVDNYAPWAYETSPAIVSAATGGSVYTLNQEVRLYFPPKAFTRDTEVSIIPLADSEVPDTLSGGIHRVMSGYEITWAGAALMKPATLEMWCGGVASPAAGSVAPEGSSPSGSLSLSSGHEYRAGASVARAASSELVAVDSALALYVFGADSTWRRLGGTVDASAERISSPITEAGRYAIFLETVEAPGVSTLSALSVTPRVFSPSGTFASSDAAIGFSLGRSGPVTVKVYNRAGRLVREVASGQYMGAGANLVRWDGRDRGGEIVEDGIYLLSVEALGEKQVKTIAVVR
jgi:ligand-binding sensor domain-containing protein